MDQQSCASKETPLANFEARLFHEANKSKKLHRPKDVTAKMYVRQVVRGLRADPRLCWDKHPCQGIVYWRATSIHDNENEGTTPPSSTVQTDEHINNLPESGVGSGDNPDSSTRLAAIDTGNNTKDHCDEDTTQTRPQEPDIGIERPTTATFSNDNAPRNDGTTDLSVSTYSNTNEPTNLPQPGGENEMSLCVQALLVNFLQELQRMNASQWPTRQPQIKQLLLRGKSRTLTRYLEQQQQNQGRTPSKAVKPILLQLKQTGCLSRIPKVKPKQFKWNTQKIKAVLDKLHSENKSSFGAPLPPTAQEAASVVVVNDDHQPTETAKAQSISKTVLVDHIQQLGKLAQSEPFRKKHDESIVGATTETDKVPSPVVVAIDCEGVPDNLFLIQVGTTASTTFVFDCVKLGVTVVCDFLAPLLEQRDNVWKLFHDPHQDAAALARLGGIRHLKGTFDTQLAAELLTGHFHMGFNDMLEHFGLQPHATKHSIKRRMEGRDLFAQRPLPPDVLQYAADDVNLLINAVDEIKAKLGKDNWDTVQRASDNRAAHASATNGERHVSFDVANDYRIGSLELLRELRPDDVLVPTALKVSDETTPLLDLLPTGLRDQLEEHREHLSEVVLDKGRIPIAWVNGNRLFLDNGGQVVDESEIASVVEKLGGFGSDNRAGLESQLHRISAMRNREGAIIGLTMRVGRHVTGNSHIISDLLFRDPNLSILFLGEPGSGKTTIVREVTRQLAERLNVCIVDTSNEIAGDGDIPHSCVGYARRMMVPSLDKQSAVMIECVQNHAPHVIIVDEIGRSTEVEAARTCKNRGVRLIASAHGDLRKLIKNPKLRGLVGGVETVTLGDVAAKEQAKKRNKGSNGGGGAMIISKVKAERAGPPTFDVIVELERGKHNEWRIILNTADAVDKILDGKHYLFQRRTRDPATGAIHLDFGQG